MSKPLLIRLPDQVRDDLDSLIPAGKRTSFVASAVSEKIAELRQTKSLEQNAGLFKAEDYPEFASTEDIVSWVNRLRAADTRWTK